MNATITRIEGRKLARFRADPQRVTIKMRHTRLTEGSYWRATIYVDGNVQTVGCNVNPYKALVATLQRARDADVPGIDYYMDWTYEHPHGAAGVKARLQRG